MIPRSTDPARWLMLPPVVLLLAALAWLLPGCGGHGLSTDPRGGSEGTARAVFTIDWPDGGRDIPLETNRVCLFVTGQGIRGAICAIVNKTAPGTTTTVTLENIPAGPKRLFSAQARYVPGLQVGADDAVVLNPSSAQLLEGDLLADGGCETAVDVLPNQTVQVTITLERPGEPPGGTVDVDVVVNQVISDNFPALLLLELIRDQDGNVLTNLTAANFEVFEDGQPCVITDVRTVESARSDLSVSLVLDRSGSMDGQPNTDLETAATTFVSLMGVDDSGEIINFESSVYVSQPFTSDKGLLLDAIRYTGPRGGTALYDAIRTGVSDAAAEGGRAGVVAMTDGGENSSTNGDIDDLVEHCRGRGVPVFCVGLAGYDFWEWPMKHVADETGGLYFYSPTSDQLEEIYRRISEYLRAQIQISFISPDPTPSGRTRTVEVFFHYGEFEGSNTAEYVY
jgi:VWFA-related protein